MKKSLSLLVMASLLIADPLIASAQPVSGRADIQEPDNGMTQGRDPEWSRPHVNYHGDREDHREYHIRKLEEHQAWHKQWKASEGTKAFAEAHRVHHENLNAAHRVAHRAETAASVERTLGATPMSRGGLIQFGRARPSRRLLEQGQMEAWTEQVKNFTR